MKKSVLFSVIVLLFVLPTATVLAQSNTASQLQAALDEWRESSEIAGAALAIDIPDQETLILVSGVSDLDAEASLVPQNRFRIGSITKTFVAAAVLQLAQEGLLKLDDPLSAYIPDFPNAENITIRHLLSHRSGIFDFEFVPGLVEKALQDPTKVWTWQEVIAAAITQEPYFAPGTGYAYSSTNFTLLGVIVEAVTGTSLDDEMRRRFFGPLGLTNTFLAGSEEVPEGVIHGYGTLPDGTNFDVATFPNTAFDTATWATGSMVSTAENLVRWAKALYNGKGDVVDGEILDEMLTFEPSFGPAPSVLHGLGVFRYETPTGVALGHTGTWFGFSSRMMYFPELDITVVVLVNRHFMNTYPIAETALSVIMEVEKETILHKTLSGHWKGDGKIIVAWCERTHLSFDLHIDEYGNVTGTIGDATIDYGHIRRNNKILRLLGNSEYIIEANLSNVLIKEEDIQRDSIRIFLHFKSPFLTGGFHTSGSKFGGKETMILSGTDIKLSKVTMKIDE